MAILVINIRQNGDDPARPPELIMAEAANGLAQFQFNCATDRDRDVVFVPIEA